MEKRYRALWVIGAIYKILGAIVGALTVVAVVATCATSSLGRAASDRFSREAGLGGLVSGTVAGVIGSLFVILWGGSIAMALYGAGEVFSLLIALEENTRTTAMMLQQR